MVPDVHRRECRTRREESRARFGLVSRDIELVAVERRVVDVSRGVANVRPPFSFDEMEVLTFPNPFVRRNGNSDFPKSIFLRNDNFDFLKYVFDEWKL